MSYIFNEDLTMGILSGLLTGIPSVLLGIASYVLSALALYVIARRRGLNKPWLAWIPVVNCWILGSLSDQYQYVVKGQNRCKRKVLLILSLISTAIGMMITILGTVLVVQVVSGAIYGVRGFDMLDIVMGPAVGMLGLCLPLVGIAIASMIIRYMALYDVYQSMDPSNSVLFLVLSILLGVTEAFFLFFNRDKDLGMPPRRRESTYIPQPEQPQDSPDKDYL